MIVLPSGRRTYCIEYRNAYRIQKRVKIGIHGQTTTEEARNLAKIQLAKVTHGEDIAEQSKQVRMFFLDGWGVNPSKKLRHFGAPLSKPLTWKMSASMTFAIPMLPIFSSGLSLSIVGKLLGHTQASTTQRYAHLADEPLRQAAELFSTKVGQKNDPASKVHQAIG